MTEPGVELAQRRQHLLRISYHRRAETARLLPRARRSPIAAEHAYGKPSQDLTITARMTLEELVAKSNEAPSRVEAAEPVEVLSIDPPVAKALASAGRRYPALTSGGAE